MKGGIHAENKYDMLENRLCGLGSMMMRNKFTQDERRAIANAIYHALGKTFPSVRKTRVFSRFFALDELNEHTVTATKDKRHGKV